MKSIKNLHWIASAELPSGRFAWAFGSVQMFSCPFAVWAPLRSLKHLRQLSWGSHLLGPVKADGAAGSICCSGISNLSVNNRSHWSHPVSLHPAESPSVTQPVCWHWEDALWEQPSAPIDSTDVRLQTVCLRNRGEKPQRCLNIDECYW